MKRLLFCLFVFTSVVACAQVRPDLVPEEENPDTSNFEVYGQKDGNLRRAALDAVGGYVLENYQLVYDSAENRLRIVAFGVEVDTINLTGTSGVDVSLSNDTLSIDSKDVLLSDYAGVLTYNTSTYNLFHSDGGTTDTISLATLVRDLGYDNNSLKIFLGSDSVDVSALRQELSYDAGTNVLSLDNGGGSVTLSGSGSGLTSVTSASYFGGDGTASDPLTIDDEGITFSKIESINSGRLLGRRAFSNGSIEEITLGSGLEIDESGLLSVSDTIDIVSSGDTYRKYRDTTLFSSNGDIPSSTLAAIMNGVDEVRIDFIVESSATSNFIVNFPVADSSYSESTVIINVIDESSDYNLVVSNIENVPLQQLFLNDNDNVTIHAMLENESYQWLLSSSNYFPGSGTEGFFEVDSLNIVGVEGNIDVSTNTSGDPVVVTLTVDNPTDIRSANIVVNTSKDFTIRITDSSGSTNNGVGTLWMPTINVYDISSVVLSGTTGENVSHNNTDFIPSSIDWSTANSIDVSFSGGDYSSKSKLLIVMTW